MYIDDVAGLGSPGTPDASPVFAQSGLSADEAAKWNAGQRRAVIAAQSAAVSKHNAFTWQNLQPMGLQGGSGMVSPDKASCMDGGPDMHTGRGFPGLRNLCGNGSASPPGKLGWDIPLFMTLWHDRPEMGRVLGHGSCTEPADCARDTCKQLDPRGGIDCAPMQNIREHIAAFQLIRGDYAWMGYVLGVNGVLL